MGRLELVEVGMQKTFGGTRMVIKKRLLLALAVVGVATIAFATYSPSVLAADGLDIEADYTYRIDESGAVNVEAVFTLKNVTPSTRRGFVRTSYYYTGYIAYVPGDALDITVTDGTRDLDFVIEDTEGDGQLVSADFRSNLFNGRSTTMIVSYQLNGSDPRSFDLDRINPAYALFGVWGFADPGRLDVRVEIPVSYEVEVVGSNVKRSIEDGYTIYEALDIEDPLDFGFTVVARNDQALATTTVEAGESTATINYWPGDTEWRDFIAEHVTDGVIVLESLIGQPWPEGNSFEFIQSSEPGFAGYAGWYDGEEEEIVLDEALDASTVLHELSHAWFNRSFLVERWQGEAFAEEFARLAMIELGGTPSAIQRPLESRRTNDGLNLWSIAARTDESELWGYTAAAWTTRQLTLEIGVEGLQTVIDTLFSDVGAYQDREGKLLYEGRNDWKRTLDAYQVVAGSEQAEEMFREQVASRSQRDRLDDRADARAMLASLEETGGTWWVPLGVLGAMEKWWFDDARELASPATEALEARDLFVATAEATGLDTEQVTLLDEARSSFEAKDSEATEARDYSDIYLHFDRRRLAINALALARVDMATTPSFFEEIGLREVDLDAAFADVVAAFENDEPELAAGAARELAALLAAAEQDGRTTATYVGVAAAGCVLLLIMLTLWAMRARRRRKALRLDRGEPEIPELVLRAALDARELEAGFDPAAPPEETPQPAGP